MAKEFKLEAQSRQKENGKAKKMRENGFIPANIYGQGFKNKHIKIKAHDFAKVFSIAGESKLIDIVIDGAKSEKVIVKDVQKDYVKDKIIHVDFYKVDMNKKITTQIPLNFIGESKAVKELGGTLIKSMDTVEVKCLPGNLVDRIDVDLSKLDNFHDAVRMNDLNLPQGMELMSETNDTIVGVVEPVKEEVEAKPEEPIAAEGEKEEAAAEGEKEEAEKEKK